MQKEIPILTPGNCVNADTGVIGTVSGLWYLEGTPESPVYAVSLLGKQRKGGEIAIAEYRAETPRRLGRQLREAGWKPPRISDMANLCESAPRSQKIVNSRRFQSHI